MTRKMTLANLEQVNREFVAPMTEEQMHLFLGLTMREMDMATKNLPVVMSVENMITWFEERSLGMSNSFLLAVPLKRLALARDNEGKPMEFSPLVLAFLMTAYTDRVGLAVLWAYTLAEETRKSGPITIQRLACDLFPIGFPTYEGFVHVWEAQKISSKEFNTDNWVDLDVAWDPNAGKIETLKVETDV